MAEIIYKPETRKGPVLLIPNDVSTPPTITLADGTVITAVKGDRAGGVYKGEHGYQWVFPSDVLGQTDAVLSVGGETQKLGNTNMSYRGPSLGSLSESSKGAVGSGTTGVSGGAQQIGDFGVAPEYIGDKFPSPSLTTFEPIPGAAQDYQYIDPIKFGREFNTFQRGEIAENLSQAKGFALDILDTEFQGLQSFVPRSAELKREQTALDNTFNQAERTRQINEALPDVVQDLNQQAADARIYARGEVPDSVINAGLEVGLRSEAADIAASSGFGARSSAAQKVSNLMSARERLGLAFRGNDLLSQNAAQRTQLFLAPTSYSTAGQQINVAPTVSGGQAQLGQAAQLNQLVNVPGSQAFSAAINQAQFGANLIQQTQQFNASNTLQNAQFNANNINNFALSFFNYLNSYVNSVAGANQTNLNTSLALDQQEAARKEANKQKDKTQQANDIQSGIGVVGQIIGGITGAFSDIRLKKDVSELKIDALSILEKVGLYQFKYKPGTVAADGEKPHIGMVAQELEKVFPEAVMKHESGFLQIEALNLIYLLAAAVKQLQQQIEKK